MLENTSCFINCFDSVDINFYGGIYTLLPFFYILRFYNCNSYPLALEHMLDIIISIFENKYNNVETEALNCHMFAILAEFINKVDPKFITELVVEKIGYLK